jgi:hypothetical protein
LSFKLKVRQARGLEFFVPSQNISSTRGSTIEVVKS